MDILFLAGFDVLKPDPGLIFWTSLIFLGLWFFLGRKAFRPIQDALKKRETDIQEALDEAKQAREEMANLHAQNEKLLVEAREERSKMLKDAKEIAETYRKEQKAKADAEFRTIVDSAKQEIENQRKAAVADLRNQVGSMAIEIAEKVLRKQLSGNAEQEAFVGKLVDDIELN